MLGRYLAAYRGNLSRQEAARRAGLPDVLWESVENSAASTSRDIPAAIVAAMCAAIGADVATGLELAGFPPQAYPHLTERPPVFSSLARNTETFRGPYIATPHVVTAALADTSVPESDRMSRVYELLAESNRQVADQIAQDPPDGRVEYWAGYAMAMRTVAQQQANAAGSRGS
jgi:hypothetical protein